MTKHKGKRKSPSRQRYDAAHPVRSARFRDEDARRLTAHLKEAGCSFAEFVLNALNKEESMIEKRVEMLAKKKAPPSFEERLKCLEDLMNQAFSYLSTHDWSPFCPYCENRELLQAEGIETESTRAHKETHTWRCSECGFFLDTPKRIDPKSIKWSDPGAAKSALKPKSPPRKTRHGTLRYSGK